MTRWTIASRWRSPGLLGLPACSASPPARPPVVGPVDSSSNGLHRYTVTLPLVLPRCLARRCMLPLRCTAWDVGSFVLYVAGKSHCVLRALHG